MYVQWYIHMYRSKYIVLNKHIVHSTVTVLYIKYIVRTYKYILLSTLYSCNIRERNCG